MTQIRIEQIELRKVSLPLVTPWVSGLHQFAERESIVVRIRTNLGEGWGECPALAQPTYSAEYTDSAYLMCSEYLIPMLLELERPSAETFRAAARSIVGHPMAKFGIELALCDLAAQIEGCSLAGLLGGTATQVPAGVVCGTQPDAASAVATVSALVTQGYRRFKIKTEPGNDMEILSALREVFPDLQLGVDANSAYAEEPEAVRQLDQFELWCIEQPLGAEDLLGHAILNQTLQTPICLDEPISSLEHTVTALTLGAANMVNLKPARVGGLLEACEIHDLCQQRGVSLFVGGLLETGIGRAANVALASLPGMTHPGDLSANARFYQEDIVSNPFELVDGSLTVPTGPGLGVLIDLDNLERFTTRVQQF